VNIRRMGMAVGTSAGVLFAMVRPVWPAVLAGNDYSSTYSPFKAFPTMEPDWTLLVPAVLTAIFGFGGGFVGRSIAEKIEDERTARLASQGRCLRCGYRLTGNTSGVCPQCGTTAPGSSRLYPEPFAILPENRHSKQDGFIIGFDRDGTERTARTRVRTIGSLGIQRDFQRHITRGSTNSTPRRGKAPMYSSERRPGSTR